MENKINWGELEMFILAMCGVGIGVCVLLLIVLSIIPAILKG